MGVPGVKPQVLVVDDEADAADLVARALRSVAQVETCATGDEALERLRDGRFLAVISDHVMPGMTGVELLEQAAQQSPHIERILISGVADTNVLSDAINRGHVGHYLPKPLEVGKLVRLVSRLAAQAGTGSMQVMVIAGSDVQGAMGPIAEPIGMKLLAVSDLDEAARTKPPPGGFDLVVWDTAITRAPLDAHDRISGIAPGAAQVCVERPGGDPEAPRLLAAGVDDVIWRPLRARELEVRVRRVLERRRLIAEAQRVRRTRPIHGLRELIGTSRAMRDIFETIERVAPTSATVLVTGETGTGKELVARVIHELSLRRDQPFVSVNCAALPETLVESELFGHERGAFTGAMERRIGRFEQADGGTLFIDEVGDVPPAVQVKLLRALQERSFERVGGNQTLRVDIRLITATNQDLAALIDKGQFRADLYYRLNVVPLHLPPLRDRGEDILLLAERYLDDYQRRMGKEGIRLSESMRSTLLTYGWPGNVRELQNVIERAVALTPSHGVAEMTEIKSRGPRAPAAVPAPTTGRPLKELVEDFERRVIVQALERTSGNRSQAARDLGITRQGLALKLKKYGL